MNNKDLENTTEVVPTNHNGNGHSPEVLDSEVNEDGSRNTGVVAGGALMDAMRESDNFTALRALVVPGEKVEELLMRADFPSKNLASHAKVVAVVSIVADCLEFDDRVGLQEVLNLIAGLTSADGKRARELVDAAIGFHRESNVNKGPGWIQEKAGFGKKDS